MNNFSCDITVNGSLDALRAEAGHRLTRCFLHSDRLLAKLVAACQNAGNSASNGDLDGNRQGEKGNTSGLWRNGAFRECLQWVKIGQSHREDPREHPRADHLSGGAGGVRGLTRRLGASREAQAGRGSPPGGGGGGTPA